MRPDIDCCDPTSCSESKTSGAVGEAQATTGTIEQLGLSSREIGAVVEVITSIA